MIFTYLFSGYDSQLSSAKLGKGGQAFSNGYCIRLFCVWASKGKKVLVQVLSGTAPRRTIRRRLFNRGLVRKWARFLLLVWLIFFQTWRAKLWISGLAFGCVFRARFWARLIDVCSQNTHFWGQNTDSKQGPETQF